MRFYKNKWYIGIHENHVYGHQVEIWQGKPYNKHEYSAIKEFKSIKQVNQFKNIEWRKQSRVTHEPIDDLIINNIPIEKLISSKITI